MAPKKASEAATAPLLSEGETSSGEIKGDDRNLCLCSKSNFFRRRCHDLVTSTGFDGFILLIIILNCVMMASDSPMRETPPIFEKVELIFNIIFTCEMTLKIIAFGLPPYLSDGWNLIDVVVVSTAWAPYLFPNMGNYSAIRAIRVLRALRTVNRVPSLKKIIQTLLSSIPDVRCHPAGRTAQHSPV